MEEIIRHYGAIIGFLTLIGIELSPIKFNPFTLLGKICGRLLGINGLEKKIDNIQKEVDINERDRIRYEILQFSGSLRNGLQRTQNDYDHIEELYEKYQKKGWNSYIHSEMDFIRNCRDKKIIDNIK